MSCDIKLKSPIYRIIYTSLLERKKIIYIFVGEIKDKNLKKVLKKIKNSEKLLKSDIELLKNSEIEDLYKVMYPYSKIKKKQDEEINIVYQAIRGDDSVSRIKKLVLVNLSNVHEQKYINVNNQCLWMEKEDGSIIKLGFDYLNTDINPKDIYKKKIKIDKKLLRDDGRLKKLELTSNNDELIENIVEKNNIKKYKIYLLNGKDIYDFIKSKNVEITKRIKNGFLKKYFPKFDLLPVTKSQDLYKKVKTFNNYQKYIFDILSDIKTPIKEFGNCSISTIKLNTKKDEISKLYKDEEIYVNLYKIFYWLSTSKSLDYSKMPLIKYKNQKEKINKIFLWKDIKKIVGIDMIKSWVNLKKKGKEYILKQPQNSIQIKKLYKFINETPIFYTIIIWDKGNVTIQVSFKENYQSTFKDIEEICNDVKVLINDINNKVELKKKSKFKFEYPILTYNNSEVKLSKFTKIDYFNSSTFFDFGVKIELKKLAKFLEIFNFIIKYKKNKNVIINSINLKYIRVSNYVNMSEIMVFIDEKKREGMSDIEILKEITETKDKTDKEADDLLKNWKIEYRLLKKKEGKNYNTGASLDIYENKFVVSGIKDPKILKRIYIFCSKIIYLFVNKDKIKIGFKLADFIEEKKLEVKNLSEESEDEELGLDDFEKDVGINNYNYDTDDFGDFNYDNQNNDDNEYIESNINDVLNKKDQTGLNEINKYDYDDSKMETQIKLEVVCKDDVPDYKHNTCGDLCNDNKYFLRRLQKYDPDLYFYKLKSSTKKTEDSQYSRSCQSGHKQPVILDYDPREREDIDPNSYKNVIQFPPDKKLFYICPDAWCPYHEKPISRNSLKEIQIKQGVNGACVISECPYGDHPIYVRKPFSLKKDKDEYFNYVGFIDKSKSSSPDGTCQLCCYKKDQSITTSAKYDNFKLCLGEDIEEKEDLDDNIYLLSGLSMPLRENRYGMLPDELINLLGLKCIGGYIEERKCFIRKGINPNSNQSFIYCFADLFYPVKPINIKKFKKSLVNAPAFTETLFKSLNNGMLAQKFYNPKSNKTAFENYKEYILGDKHTISYEYLWDLLQRPNIILETGCNIVIFRRKSTICPYYEDINDYYDENRPTIMLYTNGLYYEPIYLANGKIKKKDYTWIFHKDNYPRITEVIENIKDNCKHYYDIDLDKLLQDTQKQEGFELIDNLLENLSLKKTLKKIKDLNKDYQIDYQILDYNFKVPGIFLKNGLYLPIKPSSLDVKINYEPSDSEDIKYLNYEETIKGLNYLSKNKLNCKPIYKILDLHRKKVIGVIIETGRKIQVEPSPLINDKIRIIDISFFSNVNREIQDEIQMPDKRKEYINKKIYEDENFMRLVYEFSNYINETINSKEKKEIEEICLSKDNLTKKRVSLKKIINKLLDQIIIYDVIKFNLLDYVRPNKRIACYKSKECNKKDKFHCKMIGNKCKLLINKNNLITGKSNKETYISMLIEDLLRYENKRKAILENELENIIDKENIKFSTDLLDFSELNPKKLNEEVDKYFMEKKDIYISNKKLYDEIETENYDIDKEKYQVHKQDYEIEIYLEPLNAFWEFYLDGFEIYNPPGRSIFNIIRNYLFFKAKNDDTVTIETTNKIKQRLIEYLKNITIKYINIYNKSIKILDNLLTNKDNVDNVIVQVYNKLNENVYGKSEVIENIYKKINENNYNGNIFDILILSEIYQINILLLLKRKKNEKTFYEIKPISNKVNEYILILKSKLDIKKKNEYNSILNKSNHGFKFIFTKNEFPIEFTEYLKKSNKTGRNLENENSNEEDI